MNRILSMVLKNLWVVPGAYIKLCHYAKHSDKYSEEEKYGHVKFIADRAVKSGNLDFKVTGQENIPTENGFIIYSNHQGMFDIVAIIATCKNPLAFVLKKELYKIPVLKQVVDCTKSFPMDRSDIKQSLKVILSVADEVKKKRNYLIFPEGTRSKMKNQMLDFHGGSFKCALKAKCPIVPVALLDCYKVFDQKGSKPVSVQLHYLEPIYYEEYKDMRTKELAELVKSRIEKKIKECELAILESEIKR